MTTLAATPSHARRWLVLWTMTNVEAPSYTCNRLVLHSLAPMPIEVISHTSCCWTESGVTMMGSGMEHLCLPVSPTEVIDRDVGSQSRVM